MPTINFTKKATVEILNAAGQKTGLKSIDNWLDNPQTDHKHDWIFRVKVEPSEFSLNGEKRKIEIIDFFCNADAAIKFFLKNALSDNQNFELQWMEEQAGKDIGFSENRPNVLVVESNRLVLDKNKEERQKIRQNWDIKDLEIDWKNINLLEGGISFDLTSPQTISFRNHNFIYDKIFLPFSPPGYLTEDYEWIKKRLMEWKKNNRATVVKKGAWSTKSWLSVKDSNILYLVDADPNEGEIQGLSQELLSYRIFRNEIDGWEKLPYQQQAVFLKRWPEESQEDMKSEIQKAIQALENNNPDRREQNSVKNNSASEFPWKIVVIVSLFCLALVVIILWLKKCKAQKK